MLGADGGRKTQDLDGIIPQVASELFRQIKRQEQDASIMLGSRNLSQFKVRATYLEVFKEKVLQSRSETGDCGRSVCLCVWI